MLFLGLKIWLRVNSFHYLMNIFPIVYLLQTLSQAHTHKVSKGCTLDMLGHTTFYLLNFEILR